MIDYENLRNSNAEFVEDFQAAFKDFLDSGWYILGKGVEKFEDEFAAYHGVKHCIGVASGLDALILSIVAYDFPQGSEIIVPSNTYIATIIAIMRAGMKPVLVEPDICTYNLDPGLIADTITARTVAVLPVHLYGKISAMEEICAIAERRGLKVIEDCAQAHGARQNGRLAGTFGVGAFSFYPTKNLGALGDAGAIITNDTILANKLRKLRNYGSNKKYYFEYVGYNSRLDEVQALLLSVKLKKLDQINEHKRRLAELYLHNLDKEYILPQLDQAYHDVYHIFNIRHPERDRLQRLLLGKGIKTEIHYPVPPHKQEAFLNILGSQQLPISEEIHRTTLSLPISFSHTPDDVLFVIETLNNSDL